MSRRSKVNELIDALKFVVSESSAIRYDGQEDLFERTQKIHERAKEALREYGVPFDYASRTAKK